MEEVKCLLDYAPYIDGKVTVPNKKQVPRISMEQAMEFAERVKRDTVVEQLFNMCEKYSDFFSMHVDARKWVPKELQSDAFYTLKNGEYFEMIPAICVYIIRKAWNECSGIPNLLLKIIPKTYLNQFFADGFLPSGYRLYDVILSVCDCEYTPLSETQLKVQHKNFSEVYVRETDMVAAIPNSIADELTNSMIEIIKVTPSGLTIGGSLIRTMGGYYGITNSVYDLRELV